MHLGGAGLLRLYDVSTPSSPRLLHREKLWGKISRVRLRGSHLRICYGQGVHLAEFAPARAPSCRVSSYARVLHRDRSSPLHLDLSRAPEHLCFCSQRQRPCTAVRGARPVLSVQPVTETHPTSARGFASRCQAGSAPDCSCSTSAASWCALWQGETAQGAPVVVWDGRDQGENRWALVSTWCSCRRASAWPRKRWCSGGVRAEDSSSAFCPDSAPGRRASLRRACPSAPTVSGPRWRSRGLATRVRGVRPLGGRRLGSYRVHWLSQGNGPRDSAGTQRNAQRAKRRASLLEAPLAFITSRLRLQGEG